MEVKIEDKHQDKAVTQVSKELPFSRGSSYVTATTEESTSEFFLRHKSLVFKCWLIAFAGMLFGWDTGTIGGTLLLKPFLRTFSSGEDVQLLSWQSGLIVGSQHIGCIFGGFTIARLADYMGRRYPIVISMGLYVTGVTIQMLSKVSGHWYQIACGRFVVGLCIGSMGVLGPMFISETAPTRIRGSCTVIYQLMVCFGLFLGSIVLYATKIQYPDSDASWLVPMGVGMIPVAIVLTGILVIPESARYYISKNQLDKAIVSLEKLGDEEIEKTLNDLRMKDSTARAGHQVGFHEMLKRKDYRNRAIFASMIMFLQQMSGIDYFFYYSTTLFRYAGLSDSYVTSIIIATLNIVTTICAMFFVDKFGRKTLLLSGSAFCSICLLIYASIGSAMVDYSSASVAANKLPGTVMIVFTCLFVVAFAATWGICGGLLLAELCPMEIKAKAMALGFSFNWGSNFFIAFCTPIITQKIHYNYGFVFGACLVSGFFFVWIFIPETRNVKLEDINTLFEKQNSDLKPATSEP